MEFKFPLWKLRGGFKIHQRWYLIEAIFLRDGLSTKSESESSGNPKEPEFKFKA
jgi:hypothetical protein